MDGASSSLIAAAAEEEPNGGAGDPEEWCGTEPLLDRPAVRLLIIVAYISVFLICLFGNLFTILVICAHRSMRTATNFFLANLAVADLLVAIFCILQNMLHLVGTQNGHHWPLGETLCKLYSLVLHLVPCMGIGILVCVSVEKYIAVLHPLLALKVLTPRFRCLLMASIWGISLLFNLPYYTSAKYILYENGMSVCTRKNSDMHSSLISTRNVVTLSFVLWYCIPLGTIAFLYARIGLVLWQSAPLKKLTQVGALRTNSNETTTIMTAGSTAMPPGGGGFCSGGGKRSLGALNGGIVGASAERMPVGVKQSNGIHSLNDYNPLPLIRVTPRRRRSTTLSSASDGDGAVDDSDLAPEDDDDNVDDDDVDDEAEEDEHGHQVERVTGQAGDDPAGGPEGGAGALGLPLISNGGTMGLAAPAMVPKSSTMMTGTGTILVSTMESRKKVIRLLIAIVCSFAILTLPHHARLVYTVWTKHQICNAGLETLVQPGAYLLLFLSSSCNPFLYAFMSQRFRSAISDIFKCRRGRVRRKSTRTRTQNSDIGWTGTGGGGGATTQLGEPMPHHSSLTRLHFGGSASGNGAIAGGAGSGASGPVVVPPLALSGSERNLLLARRADSSNQLLRVAQSRGSASGGSASASTTSSLLLCSGSGGTRSGAASGGVHMAVVYRKTLRDFAGSGGSDDG